MSHVQQWIIFLQFKCFAKRRDLFGMISFILLFTDSPSFAISRIPGFGFPLREGIPVSLKCDVDSNPPASPVWVKGKN
jgi:hypothetical protein